MGNLTIDAVLLHSRMAWVDEFEESTILSTIKYALDGTLIVQYGARKGGVPMTLRGGQHSRATIIALHDLQKLMKTCTLTMQDGRIFSVLFADSNAIRPTPIGEYHDITMELYYELELSLIQIDV